MTTQFLGITNKNIKKLTLLTGEEIDMSKICNIFIVKEKETKDMAYYNTSFNYRPKDAISLSNECFLQAFCIKYMADGLSYEEAVKKYDSIMTEKRKKLAYQNMGCRE